MSAVVDHLNERLQDDKETLEDIMPSAITLAMMLRHRNMATWMRTEFDGYSDTDGMPPYRLDVAGHIVARSPQYGWIPAPVNDEQKNTLGRRHMTEGVKTLEKACLKIKKGAGHQIPLEKEEMAKLQAQINLSAELAITISRCSYTKLLRVVRCAIYLWSQELTTLGLNGDHNSFTAAEREKTAHLDNPEFFWSEAYNDSAGLPIPDVREVGFFERTFGRTG